MAKVPVDFYASDSRNPTMQTDTLEAPTVAKVMEVVLGAFTFFLRIAEAQQVGHPCFMVEGAVA